MFVFFVCCLIGGNEEYVVESEGFYYWNEKCEGN